MFQLMIKALNAPVATLFKYNTLDEAQDAAQNAMDNSFHRGENITLFLGEGTLLSVMSDEAISAADRSDAEAKRSGHLLQNDRHAVTDEDFVLQVQFGMAQVPPLVYETAEERDAVVQSALISRNISYIFEEHHDYFYIMLGSGSMLYSITGKLFLEKRREALAMHQKMLAQQAPRTERVQDPKILLPFSR